MSRIFLNNYLKKKRPNSNNHFGCSGHQSKQLILRCPKDFLNPVYSKIEVQLPK